MPLSEKQLASVAHADARLNLWHGAIRSGKTIGSLLRWLIYVSQAPRGGELIVTGRTLDSIARNVFAPLQDPTLFGPAARQVHYTRGAHTAVMLDRTIQVIGAHDAKAEMVLRGITCAGFYGDEITTLPEPYFNQLMGRMSVPSAMGFGTTNPDNPAHWLKVNYIDRAAELEMRIFHFLISDNPALPAKYVEQISREYTGLWYRRFILGEWVAAEGAVYEAWDPARHVIDSDAVPRLTRMLSLGIDYGATNPTAAILAGVGVDNRLYALDEWRRGQRQNGGGTTITEVSQGLREWLGDRVPSFVPVDPSAVELKIQLRRDGVHGVMDANNDVVYGIRTMASLLAADKLRVVDRCQGLINEFPGYSWDPKATEHGEDKPIKTADHSLDAFRYAAISTENLWHRQLQQPTREVN